jgi:DNA-directed RNA polymerase subunit RPC12/RpoP
MAIEFSCGRCGQRLGADSSKAGQVLRCPSCQELVTVPMVSAEPGGQAQLQPAGEADVIFCMKCGERNAQNNYRCTRCGEVLPRTGGLAGPGMPAERIPNYLVQAILVTIFCCWPLGIPAIVFAARVNSRLGAGDIVGAHEASRQARMWAWLSFGAGLVILVLYLVVIIIAAVAESGSARF